jgi:predicted nucleotidyltransferase
MQVTPYADVNRMLGLVQAGIRETLGDRLVGLYLAGSLVTGDFDMAVSDIDFVAATAGDLTPAEVDRLTVLHHEIAPFGSTWDNRIEVAYLSIDALRTFKERRSQIVVISPGEPLNIKDAGKDCLLNWYVVREKGITLFGPAPAALIDVIPHDEVVEWVRDHVKGWRIWIVKTRSRNSQVFAILTMCRALYTVANGDFVSKRQSALWAAEEFPAWSALIQNALRSWREDWYNDTVDHAATLPETVQFVNFAVDHIAGPA